MPSSPHLMSWTSCRRGVQSAADILKVDGSDCGCISVVDSTSVAALKKRSNNSREDGVSSANTKTRSGPVLDGTVASSSYKNSPPGQRAVTPDKPSGGVRQQQDDSSRCLRCGRMALDPSLSNRSSNSAAPPVYSVAHRASFIKERKPKEKQRTLRNTWPAVTPAISLCCPHACCRAHAHTCAHTRKMSQIQKTFMSINS